MYIGLVLRTGGSIDFEGKLGEARPYRHVSLAWDGPGRVRSKWRSRSSAGEIAGDSFYGVQDY
ncbi:MAG: hypothetical protein PHP64_00440 [Actinomycetota bacterium]|nr:hypothetical protein [Actinomycetota bacterium]